MFRLTPGTLVLLIALVVASAASGAGPTPYFEIQIVDAATGRGIPLVELITVDDVRYITDNAGRIAYHEPGQANETIFFRIEAQGYAVPVDGFNIAGVRLPVRAGESETVQLKRINRAERLYRSTGRGGYRDSILLGHEAPVVAPLGSAQVAGQDSVQRIEFRNRMYWFWGDTNRLSYPLGLFRTAGATSPLPDAAKLPIEQGLNLDYFTGDDGFARAMIHVPNQEGVVWIDGVCVAPDNAGAAQMLCRYSRRRGLDEALEQGHAIYDPTHERFEVAQTLPLEESWRMLRDHPFTIDVDGKRWLQWGNPFPVTRVPANVESILNPDRYESWSCLPLGDDPKHADPRRTATGELDWQWQLSAPVTQALEARWLRAGKIRADEVRFLPLDVEHPDQRIEMHSGTVYWNPWRQRYVMVAVQDGFGTRDLPSSLGEVWYSEAVSPQGPYQRAVKIVTHDKQTFYNPCHHPCFDAEGGRVLFFEGTYCNTFTKSPATQRYNYNQIMYRLDLEPLLPLLEATR
ncbi:MAG: hypothetical protein KDA58_06760 [Planctomycetaceae bacterium]|nr:hypothetical protein [Planctomycetaceae bacterium]